MSHVILMLYDVILMLYMYTILMGIILMLN